MSEKSKDLEVEVNEVFQLAKLKLIRNKFESICHGIGSAVCYAISVYGAAQTYNYAINGDHKATLLYGSLSGAGAVIAALFATLTIHQIKQSKILNGKIRELDPLNTALHTYNSIDNIENLQKDTPELEISDTALPPYKTIDYVEN
jgi:hypothetical protein